jgi:hypothetical protein
MITALCAANLLPEGRPGSKEAAPEFQLAVMSLEHDPPRSRFASSHVPQYISHTLHS